MGMVVNLVLDGRPAVVVGGGRMALRRAHDLLLAGARVSVIAAEPCDAMRRDAAAGHLAGAWRPYRTGDLAGSYVAIAATDDEAVNAQVARDAQQAGILVNVVDRPALCTFTMPALVRRGALTLAVTTDGNCPSFASLLREELESSYGPEYAALADALGRVRRRLMELGWDGPRIRETIAALYQEGLPGAVPAGPIAIDEFLRARLKL